MSPTVNRDKPGRCPNRECRSERVQPFVRGDRMYWSCIRCGTAGPSVSIEPYPAEDRLRKANGVSLTLWNALPRDAEPAGVARGEL